MQYFTISTVRIVDMKSLNVGKDPHGYAVEGSDTTMFI